MFDDFKMRNRRVWRVDVLGFNDKVPRTNVDGTHTVLERVTRKEANAAAWNAQQAANVVSAFVRRDRAQG